MDFRKFLNKSLAAFLMKSTAAVLSLISSLVITRNVSIDDAGLYFLALSILSFIVPWCSLGLNNTVLKIVSASNNPLYDTRVGGVVGKSMLWIFLSSLFSYCILIFVVKTLNVDHLLIDNFSLILICVFFTTTLVLLSHAIQGLGRISIAIFITGPSIHIIFISLIIYFGVRGASDLIFYYVVSASITAIISFVFWLYFSKGNISLNVDSKVMLATSLPLMLTEIIAATNNSLNNFFLDYWSSESDIAHFSIAFKIATLVSFVLFAVNRVSAPKISYFHTHNKTEELKELIGWSSKVMVGCATPILLFMLLFPEYILSYFGDDYVSAAVYLRILAISQFICALTGSVAFLLIMSGHANLHRNNVVVSFCIGVVLSLLLVPHYGALGATVSVSISLSLINVLSWLAVKKTLNINTISYVFKL
ncbi:TPA: MATE family efflux transporter [Vibrio campbellii]